MPEIDAGRLFNRLFRRALLANAAGSAVAFVYISVVAPPRPRPPDDELVLYLAMGPVYFLITVAIGYWISKRAFEPIAAWLDEERRATAEERTLVLGLPWRVAALVGAGWLSGAVVFAAQAATHHPAVFVAGVAAGIFLAGLATTGITFLIIERALRPLFARVLADQSFLAPGADGARTPRMRPRLLVSWALGSGVALIAVALAFLGRGTSTGDELVGSVVFLVLVGLFAGGVLIASAARSVSDPVERVTAALKRVEAGSLDAEVTVDDGGEIGFLQAGFNRMVAGLRERERIREAFGTYVDKDVAEHILREGTSLAGEEVEVTMLFLDIRGFTSFAERLSAPEVVATLNRLFELIVPIIHAHNGHVDKYVGDGLLAVFGAPRRQRDHANQALNAAMEVDAAVEREFGDELSVGIGLNSGSVVAGNVGGAGRFEFSVIGDAVNVAARVESATRQTGDRVLIAARTKELLQDADVELVERAGVTLKGKTEAVRIYAPLQASASSSAVKRPGATGT